MSNGIALHIGVNRCDPEHYDGWSGPLDACEADAQAMHHITSNSQFESSLLLSPDATRKAVTESIRNAAKRCAAGDFFVISYAGHGGGVKDVDGDEEDLFDETWCLYDGQLLDDELSVLWAEFQSGVRVLVLSDSCYSGTVTKSAGFGAPGQGLFSARAAAPGGKARYMPRAAARKTQRKNSSFYAELQTRLPDPRPAIQASVRLISGCQDDQKSTEIDGNGVFTRTLVTVWDNGNFKGDYAAFHQQIIERMDKTQQPNHLLTGQPSPDYDRQSPFSID